MFDLELRNTLEIGLNDAVHFLQRCKDRGEALFSTKNTEIIYNEICEAFKNPKIGMVFEDDRVDSASTHFLVFNSVPDDCVIVPFVCKPNTNSITISTFYSLKTSEGYHKFIKSCHNISSFKDKSCFKKCIHSKRKSF